MVKRAFLMNELRLLKVGVCASGTRGNDYFYLRSCVDAFIDAILANDKLSRSKKND